LRRLVCCSTESVREKEMFCLTPSNNLRMVQFYVPSPLEWLAGRLERGENTAMRESIHGMNLQSPNMECILFLRRLSFPRSREARVSLSLSEASDLKQRK
jgi:hypothetical protein